MNWAGASFPLQFESIQSVTPRLARKPATLSSFQINGDNDLGGVPPALIPSPSSPPAPPLPLTAFICVFSVSVVPPHSFVAFDLDLVHSFALFIVFSVSSPRSSFSFLVFYFLLYFLELDVQLTKVRGLCPPLLTKVLGAQRC